MLQSNFLLGSRFKLLSMSELSINHVFAANLSALMGERGFNQPSLAAKSKVSQKTISNYLNPNQRPTGANGKQPSAKLTEIAMLAEALNADPWELLIAPEERKRFEAFKASMAAFTMEAGTGIDLPFEPASNYAHEPRRANG
jgi:transcriptional regulator with XRE-family HTH domain